jgi:hypothetical protein
MDKETRQKQGQAAEADVGAQKPAATEASASKRRFIKGVISTAPVVMAVSSKPALANFCTVSGFLSGNLSNQNHEQYCGGRSPGYWINHVTRHMRKKTFTDIFGKVWMGKYGDWDHDPKLYEVLKMTGDEDRYQFGAHAVAAYQNAKEYQGTYPMSIYDVGDIVSQVLVKGYYEDPVTGKVLDVQEVVAFLSQTFDAD